MRMPQPKRLAELTLEELRALPWWGPTAGKQLAVRSVQPSEIVRPVDGPMAFAYVQDTDGNWYRKAW